MFWRVATDGNLCITESWPGQARSVYGDHDRYIQTYFSTYKGKYFTGDGLGRRDDDGYYWITVALMTSSTFPGTGRGTAEVESAAGIPPSRVGSGRRWLSAHIKGQGIYCYSTLMSGHEALMRCARTS